MINLDPLHNFGGLQFLSSIIGAPTFSASLWSGNPESLMEFKNSMIVYNFFFFLYSVYRPIYFHLSCINI